MHKLHIHSHTHTHTHQVATSHQLARLLGRTRPSTAGLMFPPPLPPRVSLRTSFQRASAAHLLQPLSFVLKVASDVEEALMEEEEEELVKGVKVVAWEKGAGRGGEGACRRVLPQVLCARVDALAHTHINTHTNTHTHTCASRYPYTHTHTHTHSLSLSHTHTQSMSHGPSP